MGVVVYVVKSHVLGEVSELVLVVEAFVARMVRVNNDRVVYGFCGICGSARNAMS